jgi:purine-nucleoside phosphorylase
MPIHINADSSDLAKVVLLPGDPQRAEYIAKTYLTGIKLYTEYRKMYGYTGMYKGKRISIQTTGMGTPSLSIIVEELNLLGVKSMIRIGTCGVLPENINISDLIISTGAHSSHDIYSRRFNGACYSAVPDFFLNMRLYETAKKMNIPVHTGTILTSENFYEESMDLYDKFEQYGTLAVEMESYALFGLSSKYSIKSAAVLTVTDLIKKKQRGTKEMIKKGTDDMTSLVLDTIADNYDYLCG